MHLPTIVLILFGSVGIAWTQNVQFNPTFHHLSFEDGLPRAEIYHVMQDSEGNMWFSTDAGVIKYDGYYFDTFGTREGLVDQVVFQAEEDQQGRIWFVSFSNELCYFEEGQVVPYQYNHVIKDFTGETSAKSKFIQFDSQGNLYYSLYRKGLIKIDANGTLTELHSDRNEYQVTRVEGKNLPSFLQWRDVVSSPDSPISIHYLRGKDTVQLGPMFGRDQNAYVKSRYGLTLSVVCRTLIDLNSGKQLADDVYSCEIDPHERGVLWLLRFQGVQKCTYQNGSIQFGEVFLPNNHVTDITWDSEGGMWFVTKNDGVYYSSNSGVRGAFKKTGLMENSVIDISSFKGDMFYSFEGGYQRTGAAPGYFKTNNFSSLLCRTPEHMVISSFSTNNGVNRNDSLIQLPYCRDVIEKNGVVYNVYERLSAYSIAEDRLDTLYDGSIDSLPNTQDFFNAVEVLADGSVILGGRNGLYEVVNRKLNEGNFVWSRKYVITDILDSETFGLVVATHDNGVLFLSKRRPRYVLTTSKGLASNKIHALIELENGQLLIGTNNGLNYISKDDYSPRLIAENDGVNNPNVLCMYATESYIYLGTQNGVFRLSKKILKSGPTPIMSKIYLKDVYIEGKKLQKCPSQLVLPHETGSLRIRFRTTNFRKWRDKHYQYRLSEDEPWIDLSSPEIIINKPLGEFKVEVRFLNECNVWSKSSTLINCVVDVPFWKRWYFIAALVLLGVVIVVFFLLKRQRAIHKELSMKNEMLSLEQRMQNARMNPHFVFNVLNSIHSFIVFGNKKAAEEYLIRFSELLRDTLEETSEGTIYLSRELQTLRKYLELEQLRSSEVFQFEIFNSLEDRTIRIPAMLLQPIVENALVHGISGLTNNGIIRLSIEKTSDDELVVSIYNNGTATNEQLMRLQHNDNNHAVGILRKRLSNYNLMYQRSSFGIDIQTDTEECVGICCVITMPIISDK